jgi:hypothetical protein
MVMRSVQRAALSTHKVVPHIHVTFFLIIRGMEKALALNVPVPTNVFVTLLIAPRVLLGVIVKKVRKFANVIPVTVLNMEH